MSVPFTPSDAVPERVPDFQNDAQVLRLWLNGETVNTDLLCAEMRVWLSFFEFAG